MHKHTDKICIGIHVYLLQEHMYDHMKWTILLSNKELKSIL